MSNIEVKTSQSRPRSRGVYMDFVPKNRVASRAKVRKPSISKPAKEVTAADLMAAVEMVEVTKVERRPKIHYGEIEDLGTDSHNFHAHPTAPRKTKTPDEDIELLADELLDGEDAGPEIKPEPPKTPVKERKKSPFLESVKVEKRPLSRSAKGEGTASEVANKPKITSVAERAAARSKFIHDDKVPTTMIVPNTKGGKGHSIALIIAIILTVILGAAVGGVVYLALFQ